MKIKLLLILALATIQIANAQKESEKYLKFKNNSQYVEGYIINNDSVKIEGLIKAINVSDYKKYASIIFVYKRGYKTHYGPAQIKAYGYLNNKFISKEGFFFKEIIIGDRVSLYKGVHYMPMPPTMGPNGTFTGGGSSKATNFYLIRKGDKKFKLVGKFDFKVIYNSYFRDCDELAQKIYHKKLRYRDLKEIVREYNNCK